MPSLSKRVGDTPEARKDLSGKWNKEEREKEGREEKSLGLERRHTGDTGLGPPEGVSQAY
jgi:hypothetical protein